MALSADRYTTRDGDATQPPLASYPVKANSQIFAGGMVALGSDGFAIAAATTATKVVGVCLVGVTGGASDGVVEVAVRRGRFKFANKGADLVTQADIANPALCYVDDDQTVRHTSTSSIAAGRPIRIDSDGVLVEIS